MVKSELTPAQIISLETTERVASAFSLLGTTIIIVTFLASPSFRRPINRLIFYASWGNTLITIATLTSHAAIRAGKNSAFCQFQAFWCSWLFPADVLWNLAMAINVYLTVFRKYNAAELRALEWRYLVACYGFPFIWSLILVFIKTESRGRIFGPATIWCWISIEWNFMRFVCTYGPAWICVLVAATIYIVAGRAIFAKRKQLRAFNSDPAPFSLTIAHTLHGHHDSTALDANKAAWKYTRSAILFLVSLLITWIPSSTDRLYTLIYPDQVSYPLTIIAGFVLPLMGFWNSVIYLIISRDAVQELFRKIIGRPQEPHNDSTLEARNIMGKSRTLTSLDSPGDFNMVRGKSDGSLGDSILGPAGSNPVVRSVV